LTLGRFTRKTLLDRRRNRLGPPPHTDHFRLADALASISHASNRSMSSGFWNIASGVSPHTRTIAGASSKPE
jgi:hypothetical protein